MQLRLKSTHAAAFTYISCGSYTAFLVCFMRREDDQRGGVTPRGAWGPHALSLMLLPWLTNPMSSLPGFCLVKLNAMSLLSSVPQKQTAKDVCHTQRMRVELSSTSWGQGININYLEFFCKEDWSLLPCLCFYWPFTRRHWNQSDRFHTYNITWIYPILLHNGLLWSTLKWTII